MDKKEFRFNFLLPKNNFLVGLGSVVNIFGNYFEYNFSKSGVDVDYQSLASDWEAIGQDIRVATSQFSKEFQSKK